MVEQVYPLANNEQAVGLDLIHDEERGKNTTLAKNSGRQAIDLFAHQKVSVGARSTQSEQAYLLLKVLTLFTLFCETFLLTNTRHIIKIKWTTIKNNCPVKPQKLVEKQVPRTYI